MDQKLIELIETQINKELFSAYTYYDVAEYYRSKSLDGFHEWFEKQAREEIEHAEKFCEFLHDKDVSFKLSAIEAPNNKFTNFRDPLVFQCNHEKYVTSLINAVYDRAREVNDIDIKNFIQWYINEQREEEKKAKDVLERYDMFADGDKMGLYQMNKDLSKEAK